MQPIVVGQSAPLSGSLAQTGRDVSVGARLYFDHLNTQGGIRGRPVRFVVIDDAYDPARTAANVAELAVREKAVAILGVVGTANAQAVLSDGVLMRERLPVVGVRSGASVLHGEKAPMLFHVRASYRSEAQAIVKLYATVGVTRFAAIFQNDAFGRDGLASIEEALTAHGLKVLASAGYERNSNKVEEAVRTVAKAEPQAVVLVATTAASAEAYRLLRASGIGGHVTALSVTDAATLVKLLGSEMARGFGVAQVMPPLNRGVPIARQLEAAVAANADRQLVANPAMLEGFVMAATLTEALKRAGPNVSRATLLQKLESLGRLDLGGFAVSFSPGNRTGSTYVDLSVVGANGKLQH